MKTKGRKENAMHRARIREVIWAHIRIMVTANRKEKSQIAYEKDDQTPVWNI